ncbi:MAG: toprim domain-containing protein [Hyphomicrobiaceae bacterium]|nr:toprim domain-containing protein [Hyphomicrobiaceae bacterium]
MTARLASNAAEVKAAVLAAMPDLVQAWLPRGEQRGEMYVALNPLRDDRNLRSFQINPQTGRWADYATGDSGSDGISLYAYLFTGGNYKAALKALADDLIVQAAMAVGATAPPARTAISANNGNEKVAWARRQYLAAKPITSNPAETYLRKFRGLKPTSAWELLRASKAPFDGFGLCHTLLAPITDLDGSITGLHRTFLQPNGAKLAVANPRRTLGHVRSNAIRLGEANDELIICEGLEDGLTLFQGLDGATPVWVAGGAKNLPLMAIPETVRTLTIAADNDPVGEQAAPLRQSYLLTTQRFSGLRIVVPY